MDWKEMLAKANQLFDECKAIVAKGDDATPDEKEHLQERIDDAMAMKTKALQLKALDEESAALQQELKKLRPDVPPETKDQPTDPANKGTPGEGPGEFKDWGEYLHAIWMHKAHGRVDERLLWHKEDPEPEGHESKQMAGNVGASGGFLIPTQFIPELQSVMGEEAIVRNYATIIRMGSRQVALPVLDQTGTTAGEPHWFGGLKFYWTEEGGEKEDSEPKFRKVNLVAKKLTGLTYASDELIADMAISLGDFLSGPLGFAGGIAWMEDYSFLRGVGGGQPRGVINAGCTLVPARAAAGAIGYVDCINMLSQFLPSGRGRWVISQSAMAQLIQMNGPAGNPSYVWQPNAREGVPGYLFGFPVHWCEKLPALGTQGDILLADFRYYVIGDREATTIEASQYPRWIYDETTWRAVHRVDGQPWLSAPLMYQDGTTQVSPFVVLGGPTS